MLKLSAVSDRFPSVSCPKGETAGQAGKDRRQKVLREFSEAAQSGHPVSDMATQENNRSVDHEADEVQHRCQNQDLQGE
jgi:hypothetical protein